MSASYHLFPEFQNEPHKNNDLDAAVCVAAEGRHFAGILGPCVADNALQYNDSREPLPHRFRGLLAGAWDPDLLLQRLVAHMFSII